MGLRKAGDFADLIGRDFKRLSARYLQLLGAASTLTPGFDEVFYNAWNGFTLQFPLILAAVTPVDDDETFQAKVRMVAGFVDLFVARRMVSFRNFGYNTVQYTMFNLIKEIRDLDLAELAGILGSRVADLEGDFSVVDDYRLHQRNSSHVKYMLARLTAWLEGECGGTATFADLVERNGKDPFEIEHIWANHPEFHPEFDSEQAFADQRNKFGALLLLPRSFNASYGDKPYSEKLPHYFGHNSLARSLHPRCYENNPRFIRLSHRAGTAFPGVPRRLHRAGDTATAAALPGDVRDDLGPGEAGPECSRSSRSAGVLAAALRSLVPATCRSSPRFPWGHSHGFPRGPAADSHGDGGWPHPARRRR